MSSLDISFKRRWIGDTEVTPVEFTVNGRPLVVIDPEDREQVERLESELARRCGWLVGDAGINVSRRAAMQAALREFANPTPRIEEPTGEWAVVLDVNGNIWTRFNRVHWSSEASPNNRQTWGELDVVRILSEGVPAEADR